MITGGMLYAASFLLNFVLAFNVYGKVAECVDKTANCTVGTQEILSKIMMVAGYIGIGVFVIGLVLYFLTPAKKK